MWLAVRWSSTASTRQACCAPDECERLRCVVHTLVGRQGARVLALGLTEDDNEQRWLHDNYQQQYRQPQQD
jgi:hypothetical protein